MNEQVLYKLKVLAESAKYDVSCSSSGTVRLPQLCRRRAVHFPAQGDAHQLLHL